MTDLTPALKVSSEACAINERGQVIVWVYYTRGSPTAFLWRRGRMTRLDPRTKESLAFAIDDEGRIIGQGAKGAFVWEDGGLTDLGIAQVTAINNHGQIIGQKTDSADHTHALLWTLNT
jgi:probable HAF family extracellular repeat protein